MKSPSNRFSGRVENYVKYRAVYPDTLLDFLVPECGLTPSSIIADLGSGTGTLTRMFLNNENSVFAIEPNAEIRPPAGGVVGIDQ